jgi:hypothetical protein
VPRSRNTRLRPKNTGRAEARRRHKEETREAEAEANQLSDQAEPNQAGEAGESAPAKARSMLAMPDIRGDIAALPRVFMKPLVWLPFGLLLLAFGFEVARQSGALPEGQVGDIMTLYIQLTLPPTSLFVFFIGGFVAPRASYLVGALLGLFDALLITILVIRDPENLEGSITDVGGGEAGATELLPLWGIAILVGVFAAGFAAWYRRFLRSSQQRAAANRANKEREQAQKAKDQARADKYEARETRRKKD